MGGIFAATFAEEVGDFVAVGAVEAGHVFDEAEDWDIHGAGHGGGFAGVEEGDFLRGGDDDDTVKAGDELHNAEGFVAGTGWEIDDEVVECAPIDFREEFTDHAHFERTAPNDRGVRRLEEEFHGDGEDVEGTEDGFESGVAADHAGAFEAEHLGNVGSGDIGVEYADNVTFPSEGGGEVDGNSGLADTAFTGENDNFVFHVPHFFSDFLFCTCRGADHEVFRDFT